MKQRPTKALQNWVIRAKSLEAVMSFPTKPHYQGDNDPAAILASARCFQANEEKAEFHILSVASANTLIATRTVLTASTTTLNQDLALE